MAGQLKSLAGVADEVSRTLQEAAASSDRADRPAKDDSAERSAAPARSPRRAPVPQQAPAGDIDHAELVHAEGLRRPPGRPSR